MNGRYNRNINSDFHNDESVSSFLMNKIMGAYKNTKESPYVKSIYQETSNVFNTYPTGSQTQSSSFTSTDDQMDTSIPENTRITLYPTYCKHDDNEYITYVKGVVTSTGHMSRKNRFLLSMARRISGSNNSIDKIDNSVDPTQFQNEFQNAITNQDSYKHLSRDDESTISSSNTVMSLPNDLVKSRMEGILAKTIPATPLNVTIGSDQPVEQLLGAKMTTDNFGMFDMSIVTPYKPSYIAVSLINDPSILQTISLEIIEPKGVSVITDIDDTIRLTGVLGDKRDVFKNIFAKPYSSCEIQGVAPWFQELHDTYKCPIHYVSNSPWQVFNVVHGFMSYFDFPVSSVHLRQYSGNLLASFTQPSAERKRPSMVALMNDFPDRKFILIGDTGEQDLEAYLSLIPNYAPQILAIYLRVVPTSLSSIGNDLSSLREIRKMIALRNPNRANVGNNKIKVDNFLKNPTGIDSDDDSDYGSSVAAESWVKNNNVDNHQYGKKRRVSIDLASNAINMGVKKLAPIVPKKPAALKGIPIEKASSKIELSNNNSDIQHIHSNTNDAIDDSIKPVGSITSKIKTTRSDLDYDDYMDFSDDSLEYDTLDVNGAPVEDRKFNLWKQKARRIIDEVPEHIKIQFWKDTNGIRDESINIIIKEMK
ncbi:hypothetical protein C6P40_000086 [Pichia californica]|uniref:Phosphatidate phosphatase APP1 catalytic domain-containing protein n=1 Tax=Pichia californica TaxID=460514 RepID=A0A9P7BI60_9ASCO|nr:hypothetical protein C6P42_000956 [[Candida] californica]KAG0691039.1 hypothetical protein C6P40_000086 [[Candida] californica]